MTDASRLVWLDLCSGMGGASQPALDRGWRVIRVDIDLRFKPDIVADVRALPLRPFHVDVLWASPPCQDFSKWGMLRTYYPNPPEPDMSIVEAIVGIVNWFQPDWYICECTSGAQRFFVNVKGLGRWQVRTGGHVLWGRLPGLIPQCRSHKGGDYKDWRMRVRRIREAADLPDTWTGSAFPDIHQAAAKIPYEIGETICRAVEQRVAG